MHLPPVSRPGHGTLFPGPVTVPCFPARSRDPVSRPGHGTPVPPQVLDDLGNRLRAAAVYSGLYILTSNELYQVLDDLGNRLRAAAAAGDVELLERLVDEVCVCGGVRCRRRRGSVRRRGESRRRRSLCAPPLPLRPAGYAPPFLNPFPGPLPLRPAARSAPRRSLLAGAARSSSPEAPRPPGSLPAPGLAVPRRLARRHIRVRSGSVH